LALADLRFHCDIAAPVELRVAAQYQKMKRFDLVVASAIMLLGAFVTREALAIRVRADRERTASFGMARVDTSAVGNDSAMVARRPATPLEAPPTSPMPRVSASRRKLEVAARDTYIGDLLSSHDSALARWPDRAGNPLRVWVQPKARHPGFDEANVPVVRQAFVEWSNLGLPVPFTFVNDSAMADVKVTWVDKFNESISGKTLWAHDDAWWIVDANIQLAVHHHTGETLDSTSIRAIAMHEVGHLLGMDHAAAPDHIMSARIRVRELTDADRATVRLLYSIPAGTLR